MESDHIATKSVAALALILNFDAAIAAHALALDATLVTANVDHVIRVPALRVEDWS